jgi:hypothetical protein
MNGRFCVIVPVCLAILTGSGMAQTMLPADPTKSVRISGRLVSPSGDPVTN